MRDPAQAQRLGKKIRASTVLDPHGELAEGSRNKIHIQLIDVQTGKVLLAVDRGLHADEAEFSAESVRHFQHESRPAGTLNLLMGGLKGGSGESGELLRVFRTFISVHR